MAESSAAVQLQLLGGLTEGVAGVLNEVCGEC